MQLRVSKDPLDKAYDDAPRRVWCRDVEYVNWLTADEFRNLVITVDGKVHHGSVRVERLAKDKPEVVEEVINEIPITAGISEMFVVEEKPAPIVDAVVEMQLEDLPAEVVVDIPIPAVPCPQCAWAGFTDGGCQACGFMSIVAAPDAPQLDDWR